MFSYIYCPHFSFEARRGLFIIGRVLVKVEERGSSGKGNEMGGMKERKRLGRREVWMEQLL